MEIPLSLEANVYLHEPHADLQEVLTLIQQPYPSKTSQVW